MAKAEHVYRHALDQNPPMKLQGGGRRQFVICSNRMDRVTTLSSFEQEGSDNSCLEYWLSRPAGERIEEVDRLRREFATLSNMSLDGFREGLPRILLVIERGEDGCLIVRGFSPCAMASGDIDLGSSDS